MEWEMLKISTEKKKLPEVWARQTLPPWEPRGHSSSAAQGHADPALLPRPGLPGGCGVLSPTELTAGCSNARVGYVPEFGVVGEFVWLFWTAAATACAAVTAVFAA